MTPASDLPNLRPLSPECYVKREILWSGEPFLGFAARGPEDFDWLERMIIETGYYEHEGVWTQDRSIDKRAMAEIMAAFDPGAGLELGCASGPVLQCLKDLGIYCEGVEISRMAIDRAYREIRDRIHHGDLLDLRLSKPYDLVFGLDVFEHLNPNRLDAYLDRIAGLLTDGGYLFANIPAYGDDPVFGLVFPIFARDWYRDLFLGRHFHLLQADHKGYPCNGHLIWADSLCWVRQFEKHGFQREEAIERAIHDKYDYFFDCYSRARKAFYVFSKPGREARREAVIARVLSRTSEAVRECYELNPPPGFSPRAPTDRHVLASEHVFFKGWNSVEFDRDGPYRWSQERSYLRLTGAAGRRLSLTLFTHYPDAPRIPVRVRFIDHASREELARISLASRDPVPVELDVPRQEFIVEITVDPTWSPMLMVENSRDARDLGVAVRRIQLLPREPGQLAALVGRLRGWRARRSSAGHSS